MQDKVLMIDEILAGAQVLDGNEERFPLHLMKILKVIDFENVYDAITHLYQDKEGFLSVKDCQDIRPQLPLIWVESRATEETTHKIRISSKVISIPLNDYAIHCDATMEGGFNQWLINYELKASDFPEETQLISFDNCFSVAGKICFIGQSFILADKNGKAITDIKVVEIPERYEGEGYLSGIIWQTIRTLLVFQFMNCKNVSLQENAPSDKFRKARFKRHGVEPVKYHTIHLDPFGTAKNAGESTGNGFKKSLHICRGHFSTYTEEKPLFGKYSGTYWIPAHVRGDKEIGVVKSRYDFKA